MIVSLWCPAEYAKGLLYIAELETQLISIEGPGLFEIRYLKDNVQDLLGPCLDLPLALLIEPIDIAWRIERVRGRVDGQFPIHSESDRETIIGQTVRGAIGIDTNVSSLPQ